MNEKEKYMAEIEARMKKMDETLNTIRIKEKMQQDKHQTVGANYLGNISAGMDKLRKEYQKLEAGEEDWKGIRDAIEAYSGDIDKNLQEALAYYK